MDSRQRQHQQALGSADSRRLRRYARVQRNGQQYWLLRTPTTQEERDMDSAVRGRVL